MEMKVASEYSSMLTPTVLDRSFENLISSLSVVVGSRGAVERISINGKSFVARLYRRGGLVQKCLKVTFLRSFLQSIQDARPFKEYESLEELYLAGLHVPQPAAILVKWGPLKLWYRAMLVTREIENAKTLLELLDSEEAKVSRWIASAASLIADVLNRGFFHVDLHLGNVLVDAQGEVYIIDFDKVIGFEKKELTLYYRNKTLDRWMRSVKRRAGDNAESKNRYYSPFEKTLTEAIK